MSGTLRTTDFFSLEAGECLNRLEALLARPEGVSGEEFVRQVRLLRGAALMANLQPVAQAGAAFEALARSVRDGQRPWDAATRELALQVVDDFRGLVRRASEWGEGDTARARRIAAELERQAGATPSTPGVAQGSQTGVRAFVAREGALIASALDRAARAMRSGTDIPDTLHAVLRRMQPLRGLAELSELSPLPEILDGVELVSADLSRSLAAPPGADDVLGAAAQALNRVTRDITDAGRPAVDAPEARHFTDLLLRTFADERDVVPIEALLADGEVAAGPDRSAAPTLGTVELTSHGEHLVQAADRLAAAHTDTERDLRLFGLLASLRTLATSGRGQAPEISDWARAVRTRIGDGTARAATPQVVALLQRAGALLRQAATSDAVDAGAWQAEVALVDALGAPRAPTATAAPAAPAAPDDTAFADLLQADAIVPADDTVPIAALEPDPTNDDTILDLVEVVEVQDVSPEVIEMVDVVDVVELIEVDEVANVVDVGALAPDPVDGDAIVEIASLAPDPVPTAPDHGSGPSPFEASLTSYADLLLELGVDDAPIEALVPTPSTGPERLPDPEPIVTMESLLYRGPAALRRAAEVQAEMRAQLARGQHIAVVRPLLDELLDLVPLALDGA